MHQRFVGWTRTIVTSRFRYGLQLLTLQWEKPQVIGRGKTIQMPLSEPRVSIVILNWNSYQVTLDCLLSLHKMDYRNFEVVPVTTVL